MRRDAVAEIRERTDIVELINAVTPLKKAGRSFKGLCPFHQEKTPSFVVFPDSQNFHCFGCGKGGDIFTFYMESEKVEFPEALRELARRAGVDLTDTPGLAKEQDERRERLLAALDLAATFYHHLLLNHPSGAAGRQLAEKRGLDQSMIERFRIGVAPDRWDALLTMMQARGFDAETLVEAGLIQARNNGEGYYDRFRNRLIFPIADRDGHIVGFGARAFGDDQPKYLNSPQSALFDKSSLLYGLHLARTAIRELDQVIIVEGYMDAIAAHQFGHANVVAAMGTSLTESQIGLVKRFSKRIVLALDQDAAGQMATLRSLEAMPDALDHRDIPVPDANGLIRFERKLDARISILQLPVGKDPDELLRNHPELWDQLVEQAVPFLDFVIDVRTNGLNLDDPRAKSAAFAQIAPLLRQIGDQVTQQHYLGKISSRLQIPEQVLWSELRRTEMRATAPRNLATASKTPAKRIRHEDYLTAVLLKHASLSRDFLEALGDDDLLDSRNREIVRLLRLDGADQVEPDVLLAGLDEQVEAHGSDILALLADTPSAYPGQIRQAAAAALNGIRRERLQFLMRQMQIELAAAQQEQNQEAMTTLLAQMAALAAQKQFFEPPRSPYFKDLRDDPGYIPGR